MLSKKNEFSFLKERKKEQYYYAENYEAFLEQTHFFPRVPVISMIFHRKFDSETDDNFEAAVKYKISESRTQFE